MEDKSVNRIGFTAFLCLWMTGVSGLSSSANLANLGKSFDHRLINPSSKVFIRSGGDGKWAVGLKSLLSERASLIVPSSLVVPVGEVRKLRVSGKYLRNPSIKVENPEVCHVVSDRVPFSLKGLRPGKTKVSVGSGNLSQSTLVTVVEAAGMLPKETSLVVTGDVVSSRFLHARLIEALNQKIVRKPGTVVQFKINDKLLPQTLAPGEAVILPVGAEISGGNYLRKKGVIKVTIENQPMVLNPTPHLIISNNPENFTHPGLLFKGQFPDGSPSRVFYHHYNKGKAAYLFELQLTNPSDRLTKIHVMDGIAGPDPRELSVGAGAAERFFAALKHNLGKVIEVSSGKSYPLVVRKVRPGESVSGILRISALDGTKPVLETRARSLDGREPDGEMVEDKVSRPKGIYEGPEIAIDSEYTAGGDYTFIKIGKTSLLVDAQNAKVNRGNYGVFYTVNITLKNPTLSQATAHINFTPQAGPAKGVFLLNGTDLIKTPVVSAFAPYSLTKVELKPGETQKIQLRTMPVAGSFYPISIVVQP